MAEACAKHRPCYWSQTSDKYETNTLTNVCCLQDRQDLHVMQPDVGDFHSHLFWILILLFDSSALRSPFADFQVCCNKEIKSLYKVCNFLLFQESR